MKESHYNVKAVCRLTSLNEHTLRSWERRYRAIIPDRQENKRRLYSREDVERLRLLVRLVEQGYAIGQVALLPDRELRDLVTQHEEISNSQVSGTVSLESQKINTSTQGIIKSLENFDLESMQNEIEQARMEHSSRELVLNVFLPIMVEVGNLVFNGRMEIAHEHALTALIRAHLLDIFFQIRRLRSFRQNGVTRGQRHLVVVSTPEGDLHEIGILAASILCADAGLCVAYIGPNMPSEPLARVATVLHANSLLLGLAPLPPGTTPMSTVQYIENLGSQLPAECEIWLGGYVPPATEIQKVRQTMRRFSAMKDLLTMLTSYVAHGNLNI